MTSIICDAGPLIHLDELNCLDLLDDFAPIWVPRQVCDEVLVHRPQVFSNKSIELSQVDVTISRTTIFQTLVRTFSLDLGEQAALTLMQTQPADILLTDDTAARLAAQSLMYRVHGTIGVLIRSIRRNQCDLRQVVSILESIPTRSTLHVRPSFLQSVIDQIEK